MASQASNYTGTLRPPLNANAVVLKNQTATMTQSPYIIPFFNYFKQGRVNNKSIQPPANWLTRK